MFIDIHTRVHSACTQYSACMELDISSSMVHACLLYGKCIVHAVCVWAFTHSEREREKCCSSAVNAFCTPRKLQTVEATPPIYWNHLHELEAQILLLITMILGEPVSCSHASYSESLGEKNDVCQLAVPLIFLCAPVIQDHVRKWIPDKTRIPTSSVTLFSATKQAKK